MGRAFRRAFGLRLLVVLALVAVALPSVHRASAATAPGVTGIAERLAKLIRIDAAQRPPVPKIRVAVISTGVDAASFPKELSDRITGARGDPMGFGTYAASVLFQLAPEAQIASFNVYSGKSLVPGWLAGALSGVSADAKNLDAVVLAFPPADYLDPITSAMTSGSWGHITDALGEARLDTEHGEAFGLPMDGGLFWRATKDMSAADRNLLASFRSSIQTWNAIHDTLRTIAAAGVPVVAPAGDGGPNVQTVHGIASLAEVETVGGFESERPSALSGSGPSIDGRVKPDVLAPTGIVGLLPQSSVVAKEIESRGLVDPSLRPAWSFADAPTKSRSRLDTTIASAAYVTAAMAGMSAGGVRDVPRQRAALAAAALPFGGVPAWRQGAGQLRFAPSAHYASSRSLVGGNGDLGAAPASGAWTASLTVFGRGAHGSRTRITDFAGTGPDGKTYTKRTTTSAPVSARVSKDGVDLSLPLGNDSYEGGLYCGYTSVSIPATGDDADPRVHASGIPAGTEQVPTCFVEGSRLRAFGFYIHDLPAENLTFGLLPATAPGASLLDKPMSLLPIDPLHTKLFFKVTGKDGNAYFSNVPPGFYTVRQWSDYGSPITQTVANSRTGAPVKTDADIGEVVSYQSFDALILSSLCTQQVTNAAGEDLCTRSALEKRFGADNVTFDPTTWTYIVTIAPGIQQRIVFDKLKKMPGTAVSSRYIDLVSYDDFDFLTSQLPLGLDTKSLDRIVGQPLLQTWSFAPSGANSMSATYNPLLGVTGIGGSQVGVAWYPFNLTTPNYKMHMSLDFGYTLRNAAILVAVQAGEDAGAAAVTPVGQIKAPLDGASLGGVFGSNTGKAHFDFNLLPKGASQGKLWLFFVPPVNTFLAEASVKDMSFELDTWTNDVWPPATFPGPAALIGTNPLKPGTVAGHSFVVNPNYSARQMSHAGCRPTSEGGVRANVCEDWVVMVHSPGDDAATFDVTNTATRRSVKPELVAGRGALFDPHRGTHDFTQRIAFDAPSLAVLEASIDITNAFKTNGRFWEQLALPKSYLSSEPGPVQFRIVDNVAGRGSMLLGVGHRDGGVTVAPYVPFAATSSFLGI